jgi:aspartyl-tRNA(Asn)/glutamyl-tRNA(Gln) amidotransferase subunit A
VKTCELTVCELAAALEAGELTSLEATQACLERIDATADLGAFLHVDPLAAMGQAMAADARRAAGARRGPLDGIPLALKDNLVTTDAPTTCGSRMLSGYLAPYDATVVGHLRRAGAVFLGKLSMDEFAMGSSNEHCAWGVVKNPWDPTRVPGGSSGGAAVAVATGAAFAALASDTGGSIRQPAAFCGVVGLRPTYGRVSRYGLVAFASSLDQVGPMTRDVRDCALLLDAIAGHDRRDATCAHRSTPGTSERLEDGVEDLRVGVPVEYFDGALDAEVQEAVERAIADYRDLGAEVIEVSLPHTEYALACYTVLATAEAASNLARYDGVRYGVREDPGRGLDEMYLATRGAGFGREVKRRIVLGTFVLSAGYIEQYYQQAQRARQLLCQDFDTVFAGVDCLVAPVTPTVAFPLGERVGEPLAMYQADVFTVASNLAGLPSLAVPCGFSSERLPIGMQLIGPAWSEATLLRAGCAYERRHDRSARRPS